MPTQPERSSRPVAGVVRGRRVAAALAESRVVGGRPTSSLPALPSCSEDYTSRGRTSLVRMATEQEQADIKIEGGPSAEVSPPSA